MAKMYKFIFNILLICFAVIGKAQTIDGKLYTPFNNYYQWIGGKFNNNLNIPKITAITGRDTGGIRYNIADSSVYVWTGSQWRGVGSSLDTTSLSNRINARVKYTDTAAMLSPYLRSNVAAATYVATGSAGSLQNLTITGTNGNGHIHLRHQSSLPTATGQSTVIYANNNGDFAYKNDGNYHTTFATNANTADRTYTFQNKSYTVADNADVVKYTDTASMLNGRLSGITLNTSSAIHTSPVTFSRVGGAWSGTLSLANQSGFTIFRRASGTGTPSFGTIDSSYFGGAFRGQVRANTNDYRRDIDTVPLAVFNVGSAAAGDTAAFSTSTLAGSFYLDGTDTMFITSYRVALQGTSASITPEVWFNDSLNVTAGGTRLATGSAITNLTTGTSVTATTNKIPPGNFVFVRFSAVATKPTYFTLTLFGYRIRKQ